MISTWRRTSFTAQSRWHNSHQNSKPSVDRRSGFMHDAEAHDILSPKRYVTYIHTHEKHSTRAPGGRRHIKHFYEGARGRRHKKHSTRAPGGRRHMKHIYEGAKGRGT